MKEVVGPSRIGQEVAFLPRVEQGVARNSASLVEQFNRGIADGIDVVGLNTPVKPPLLLPEQARMGGQLEVPQQILGGKHMEGSALRPRPNNGTALECVADLTKGSRVRAQCYRGECPGEILPLHAHHGIHCLGGCAPWIAHQPLGYEAQLRYAPALSYGAHEVVPSQSERRMAMI